MLKKGKHALSYNMKKTISQLIFHEVSMGYYSVINPVQNSNSAMCKRFTYTVFVSVICSNLHSNALYIFVFWRGLGESERTIKE